MYRTRLLYNTRISTVQAPRTAMVGCRVPSDTRLTSTRIRSSMDTARPSALRAIGMLICASAVCVNRSKYIAFVKATWRLTMALPTSSATILAR